MKQITSYVYELALVGLSAGIFVAPVVGADVISSTDYRSIQEAIDKNPGQMIYVPAGDHKITKPLVIANDNSGLYGDGRIIQTSPDEQFLWIKQASGVRIRHLTLTRIIEKLDVQQYGILAEECENLCLDGLQIIDHRSRGGAIAIVGCRNATVQNCCIDNYMTITVEDRLKDTAHGYGGYAFHDIDGTGIQVFESTGTLIQFNRIIESRLKPTPELQKEHQLGFMFKKLEQKPPNVSDEDWNSNFNRVWHQGSGMIIGQNSDRSRVIGNLIENAAQGIDIHSDHIIVSNNIVNNSFMGMKAMHGSRNVLILGNQFSKNALWSIGLMPGVNSCAAAPGVPANVDGGSIVASNIISDFGYGDAYWMWGGPGKKCYPLRFTEGQEAEDPPLRDVLIQGNVVYDSGRDGVLVDGRPKVVPPRYKHAVDISQGMENETGPAYRAAPRGLHFADNIFHPGEEGISNSPLTP